MMKLFFKNNISLKISFAFLFLCTITFAFFTPISFDITENPHTNNKIDRQYNSLSTFMQKHNNIFEIESTPTADPSINEIPEKNTEKKKRTAPENLACEWLSKNQEPEGYWDTKKHGGNGTTEENVLSTGFALLCFLGAGHTEKVGKYKATVKTALLWFAQQQRKDGSWANDNFLNAVCTMAIAEATGMDAMGTSLREQATLATTYLLKQQNEQGFFDQTPHSMQSDMFVTSWCTMALRSAIIAGISENDIKETFIKCTKFLDETHGTDDNSPESKGLAWSRPSVLQGDGTLYQAAAMMIRTNAGWKRNEPWLQAAIKGQLKHYHTQYKDINPYQTCLDNTIAFSVGGEHWKNWLDTKHRIVFDAQRRDGDFAGSWDPNKIAQPAPTDRITYTAILGSTFQIYYKYRSAYDDY